jgi:hypothetical protein
MAEQEQIQVGRWVYQPQYNVTGEVIGREVRYEYGGGNRLVSRAL